MHECMKLAGDASATAYLKIARSTFFKCDIFCMRGLSSSVVDLVARYRTCASSAKPYVNATVMLNGSELAY